MSELLSESFRVVLRCLGSRDEPIGKEQSPLRHSITSSTNDLFTINDEVNSLYQSHRLSLAQYAWCKAVLTNTLAGGLHYRPRLTAPETTPQIQVVPDDSQEMGDLPTLDSGAQASVSGLRICRPRKERKV